MKKERKKGRKGSKDENWKFLKYFFKEMKNETIELYFLNFYFFLFGIVFHNLKEGKNGSVVLSIQLYYEKWNFKIEKKKKNYIYMFYPKWIIIDGKWKCKK